MSREKKGERRGGRERKKERRKEEAVHLVNFALLRPMLGNKSMRALDTLLLWWKITPLILYFITLENLKIREGWGQEGERREGRGRERGKGDGEGRKR